MVVTGTMDGTMTRDRDQRLVTIVTVTNERNHCP